jgi:hypothetical protein
MLNVLPDLSFKFENKKELNLKTENNNKITNNIIFNSGNLSVDENADKEEIVIAPSTTPQMIKSFKDQLLIILINYFKQDVILLNNLIELSKYLIMKEDDLKHLIAILVCDNDTNRITMDYELPSHLKCCSKCESIPIYKKITSIIIDKKHDFKVTYNQYCTQMQTVFNISLDYIIR